MTGPTSIRTRALALGLICALVAGGAGLAAAGSKKKPEVKKDAQAEFSVDTILNPTLVDLMHEIFRHYITAGTAYGQKDYGMAVAHLDVTLYSLDLVTDLVPEKDRAGKPINKTEFLAKRDELKANLTKLRDHIAKKQYAKADAMAPEQVTSLCVYCHAKSHVPPPWPKSEGEAKSDGATKN